MARRSASSTALSSSAGPKPAASGGTPSRWPHMSCGARAATDRPNALEGSALA